MFQSVKAGLNSLQWGDLVVVQVNSWNLDQMADPLDIFEFVIPKGESFKLVLAF